MNSGRLNSASQSRLLNVSMWALILAYLLAPWCGIINSSVPRLGSMLLAVLSAGVMCLSVAGLRRRESRSAWFVITLVMAMLVFIHALHPIIGFPVMN